MRRRARGEYEWALEVVGRLQVPERASLDEMVVLVARQVGRPLTVVPIDAPVTNGALEEGPGGALWIRVPADVSGFYRQHLVCRGLAVPCTGKQAPVTGGSTTPPPSSGRSSTRPPSSPPAWLTVSDGTVP